jgi:hypothetical protein
MVIPGPAWRAAAGNAAGAEGATIGSTGSTAGGAAQKASKHAGVMPGAGLSCCGHRGQAPEDALKTLEAALSCGICMGIGMATAATIWPISPMPKARSRARERKRIIVPWPMRPQITPAGARFKLAALCLTSLFTTSRSARM